jgi:hypothetical protein
MRGQQEHTAHLFSYISTGVHNPANHPVREVRHLADQSLDRFNPQLLRSLPRGRSPLDGSEQLLLAMLLQAMYGIRSERILIEQLVYSLLFRRIA